MWSLPGRSPWLGISFDWRYLMMRIYVCLRLVLEARRRAVFAYVRETCIGQTVHQG